jgi:hypothetical protein
MGFWRGLLIGVVQAVAVGAIGTGGAMGLIEVVVVIVVLGVIMYLVENYVPMAQPFKVVLRVIVVLLLVLWLLSIFGLTGPSVPRFR